MPWVFVGGKLHNMSRSECEDFDIDVNEGREGPEPMPKCTNCGGYLDEMAGDAACACERCHDCGEVTDGPCGACAGEPGEW
jgi:hypothetical protein